MKTCARCLRTLLVDCFARNARASDGLQSYCRDCKRAYARQWLRNADDETRARHLALKKERRGRYREQEAAKHKEWLATNRDRSRGYDAKRRATQGRREYQAEYWKKWRAQNLEQAREWARRGQHVRRARKRGGDAEQVDNAIVFDRDSGLCAICGELADPTDWHLDHIVPLALGGDHTYDNVRVTHPTCNMRRPRGARDSWVAAA